MEPVYTEVLRAVKEAVVKVRIMNPVSLHFLGDRRRIFAQVDDNLFECKSLI